MKLLEEQAGFKKNQSATKEIATLRITVEQSLEMNSKFIDYKKVFDSIDRATLR